MKKLEEIKELKPETLKISRLPLENCLFSQGGTEKYPGTLKYIGGGLFPFVESAGSQWSRCFEVIPRCPRDVPEGVAELPEELPQLAYAKKMIWEDIPQSAYIYTAMRWIPFKEFCRELFDSGQKFYTAIDVSIQWSAKNFPDIVEAMEYKELREPEYQGYRGPSILIGHKLGKDIYALDWRKLNHIAKTHNKYRKKPVEVEAIQWVGKNHRGMFEFLGGSSEESLKTSGDNFYIDHSRVDGGLIIKTLEGDHAASLGDYIIKGVNGEFYLCKPDIFEKTYEEMSEL